MTIFFFKRLSYSFGNEDWKTEQKALQIRPEDRVLCITASGDRPLNLLVDDCKEIVCVDANPIQNYLLNLKSAAMLEFDYPDYLSFLGCTPSANRKKTLRKIINGMEDEAAQFWLKNQKMIANGVLYEGAVERLLSKKVSRVVSLFRSKKVKQLFEFDDLEKQKSFMRQHWDSFLWRKTFELGLNPFFTKLLGQDPGLYAHVPSSTKPGSYIYKRMNASLEQCLAKENPLLSLILQGKVSEEAFPPYLTHQGTEMIKKRLDRLSFQTANVVDYLEAAPESTFDCFSLSDVASYLSHQDFIRLLEGIYKTAKPGARFSIRQFLSSYSIPPHLQPFFERDTQLEQQLEQEDRCFVYRFTVGKIVKDK